MYTLPHVYQAYSQYMYFNISLKLTVRATFTAPGKYYFARTQDNTGERPYVYKHNRIQI